MARLLVNKHFNEHESAKNGFSASEEYLFGEIVICNDSENPSIYIKDTEMNSVAIGDVLIESDDKILSKENRIIRSSIGLVWDETVESIKLIGNNGNIISEIPIFGDKNIGDKIDTAISRVVEVNSILTNSTNLPEGTEEGKEYLEIKVLNEGKEDVKYISFISSANIFGIEGTEPILSTEEVKGTEGDINVSFNEDLNKYVVSHGEVGNVVVKSTTNTFGTTNFVKEIEVNKLGHITSITTGTLPSLPSNKIIVDSITGESTENYYVSSIEQSVDDLKFKVEYTKLPELEVGVNQTIDGEKTTKFVSSISGNGTDVIDVTYADVELDSYIKRAELEVYVTNEELDSKLVNLGITDEEGNVREVNITIDNSECGDGKFVNNIVVDATDKTKLYLKTQEIGLNKYVSKSELTNGSTDLLWDNDVTLFTIDDKNINARLPLKPGVTIAVEEDSDATEVLVGVNTSENETNEIVFNKRNLDFGNLMYKKDVATNETTLQWPSDNKDNATTIATIGGKEIKVALPEPIEITVEDSEAVEGISSVVTDVESTGHILTLHKGTIDFKNYVSQSELAEKKYLNANNIKVVDSEDEILETDTFIKTITSNIDDNNNLEFVVEYGKNKVFDIDEKVVYTPTPTLVWGDDENGSDGISIVKIGSKDIKVKLPNEPKIDVDSKIVTYDIDSTIDDKKVTVSLKGYEGGNENTQLDKITSFDIPFVSSGEVNNYVSLSKSTSDNLTQNKFIQDIKVNGTQITPVFGDVSYNFEVTNNRAELPWGEETEIAKINGTSITVKTLVPEKGEEADGNTKYELSGGQEDENKVFKIVLAPKDTSDTSSTVTLDLNTYAKSTEVNEIVENVLENAGKVKDVHVNNSSVLDDNGIANVDLSNYVKGNDLPNFEEFAKQEDIPSLDGYAKQEDIPSLDGYATEKFVTDKNFATETFVTTKIAEAQLSGDVSIPVTDVQVDGTSVVSNTIANISLKKYALTEHFHNASAITEGVIDIERLPIGDGSNNVAVGNHVHNQYITSADTVQSANVAKKVEWDNVENRPTLSNVATSGSYTDLNNTPDLSNYITSADTVQSANVAKKVEWDNVENRPTFSDVATSGDYMDLINTPDLSGYLTSSSLDGYAKQKDIPSLDGYATETFVTTKIAEAQFSGDVSIPVTDVQVDGKSVVSDNIANISLKNYALIEHFHNASAITGGVIDIERLPIGNESNNVAIGNHVHNQYITSADTVQSANVAKSVEWTNVQNRPTLSNVATSGNYADLSNTPDLSGYITSADTVQNANVAKSVEWTNVQNRPTLSDVATSGDYADLSNTPDLSGYITSADTVQSANVAKSVEWTNVQNKPTLSNVATSGSYTDLINTPDLSGYITSADTVQNANVAKKIGETTIGSETIPVYIDAGVPKTCNLPYLDDNAITKDYLVNKLDGYYLTGEVYKGTVTKIDTGIGLVGGTIDSVGTIKVKLNSETPIGTIGSNKVYGVGVDENGNLAVNVPWEDDTDTKYTPGNFISFDGNNNIISVKTGTTNDTVAVGSHNHDNSYVKPSTLDDYATKSEVSKKQDTIADLATIRTGAALGATALQSVPSEYVTETELKNKGYLTEHQDISGKQNVISDLDTIRSGAALGATALQSVPSEYVTETELNGKNYLTSSSLDGYATQTWVTNKGYLTSSSLNSYATQKWVEDKGYATQTWVTNKGYATQTWVTNKGYLTSSSLNSYATQKWVEDKGYATQTWVANKGYLTSSSLNSYATQTWVEDKGYLTSSSLTGYATQTWVENKGYATQTWVTNKGYLTSSSLDGYATQTWVTNKGYLTSSSLNGYAKTTDLANYLPLTGGTLSGSVTGTAFFQKSDERLKEFQGDIDIDFDKLKTIPKKYYTWKGEKDGKLEIGTSAQKLQCVYPELVGGTEDTTLTVDYTRLSIVALKAVDKLYEENQMLRKELDEIKKHLGL